MTEWCNYKLGEFLKQYRNTHMVEDDVEYGQITISKTNTISFREKKIGKHIGRKRQFFIDLKKHPHTLIFTRQGVADGSIGLAPLEVDDCIATENMPMFSVDVSKVHPALLSYLLQTDDFRRMVKKLTPTGSAQKAIHERDLLELEFLLPKDLDYQSSVVEEIDRIKGHIESLEVLIDGDLHWLSHLRQTVLQEAIEGKLTAEWRKQNPELISGENHASELLDKIRAEKDRLIKDGKIPQEKPLSLTTNEKPFDLPEEWAWCSLNDISDFTNGKAHEKFVTSKGKYILVNSRFVSTSGRVVKYSSKSLTSLSKGDIAIVMSDVPTGGALARCFYVDRDDVYTLNQRIGGIKVNKHIYDKFVLYLLNRNNYFLQFDDGKKQTNLRKNQILCCPMPVPSYEEQKEIVRRVDKLVATIVELEKQVSDRKEQSELLMQSVLREAFEHSHV